MYGATVKLNGTSMGHTAYRTRDFARSVECEGSIGNDTMEARESRLAKYAARYAEGKDIHSGEYFAGDEFENWLAESQDTGDVEESTDE